MIKVRKRGPKEDKQKEIEKVVQAKDIAVEDFKICIASL